MCVFTGTVGIEDGGFEKVPVLFDFIRILLFKAVPKKGLNSLLGGRFVHAVQVQSSQDLLLLNPPLPL